MKHVALYYPHFVPDEQWLKDSLLLWDGVSSIVPEAHREECETPDLRYLHEEGLYQPVDPYELVRSRDHGQKLLEEFTGKASSTAISDEPSEERMRLSFYKLSYEARQLLEGSEFVHGVDGDWIEVPFAVGRLYMQLLAKHLASSRRGERRMPCTSSEAAARETFEEREGSGWDGIRLSISGLMPRVAEDASLRSVVEFRQAHEREWVDYQRYVRELMVELGGARSPDDFWRRAELLLDRQSATLERLRRPAGSLLKDPSAWTAVAALMPCAAFGPGGVGLETNLVNLIGGAGAALTAGISVYQCYCSRTGSGRDSTEPLTYIHSAAEEGLLA